MNRSDNIKIISKLVETFVINTMSWLCLAFQPDCLLDLLLLPGDGRVPKPHTCTWGYLQDGQQWACLQPNSRQLSWPQWPFSATASLSGFLQCDFLVSTTTAPVGMKYLHEQSLFLSTEDCSVVLLEKIAKDKLFLFSSHSPMKRQR